MTLNTHGIDHINLQVNDLNVSIAFWKALFGFEVLEAIPDENGAIIGNKSALLALYQNNTLDNVEKRGFSHVCFHVPDFDQAIQLCNELDIPIRYGGVINWPDSKSLYISDPNGYEIELTSVWGGGLV
jgi:catechol 2,3-dioxygenase-like lactoylglutathione lyase family enzyme